MKTFQGNKSHDEIVAGLKAAGFVVDTSRYDSPSVGSDWIRADNKGEKELELIYLNVKFVMISTWNGQFFGELMNKAEFDHESENLDDEPWYAGLLNIMYKEKVEAAGA